MSNVVKLVNGGTIQVRTGVIQGIGPVGPRGAVGATGMTGEQGPQGETGAMGQILQVQGRYNVSSANVLAAATDTVMAFGDIRYDDMSAHQSSSNYLLRDVGDYLLSVYLGFDDAAAGSRSLWLQSVTGGLIARTTRQSVAGGVFYIDLTYPYRVVTPGNETINVLARSAAALNVSVGALTITRVGSGPVGLTGIPGPQGPVGATGAKGDPGAQGSAGGVYTTYTQLSGKTVP
jgi:collagen type VII alpha